MTEADEIIYSTLTSAEAEAGTIFHGPPYLMLDEEVFDETDLCGCEPLPKTNRRDP